MKEFNQESYAMPGIRQATVNPYGTAVSPYGMYGAGTPAGTGYPQQQQMPFFPPQPSGATIPGMPAVPGAQAQGPASQIPGMLPLEESFIENILRLNKGKVGTFYFTYENNNKWNAKVYRGVIEAAGRDHLIISDPETGQRHLLLMVNFDYAEFDEELNYEYPYAAARPRPFSPR